MSFFPFIVRLYYKCKNGLLGFFQVSITFFCFFVFLGYLDSYLFIPIFLSFRKSAYSELFLFLNFFFVFLMFTIIITLLLFSLFSFLIFFVCYFFVLLIGWFFKECFYFTYLFCFILKTWFLSFYFNFYIFDKSTQFRNSNSFISEFVIVLLLTVLIIFLVLLSFGHIYSSNFFISDSFEVSNIIYVKGCQWYWDYEVCLDTVLIEEEEEVPNEALLDNKDFVEDFGSVWNPINWLRYWFSG